MATTTNIFVSKSIGTSPDIGDAMYPYKFPVSDGTLAFCINARVTNLAGDTQPKSEVIVRYVSTSFDLPMSTPALALAMVSALGGCSRFVAVKPSQTGSGVTSRNSILEDYLGGPTGFFYFWLELPAQLNAQKLDVNLIEYP